jgi:aspartate ammonia-lyase
VVGISANVERSEELLRNSLVLATALAPRIGYERAATVAKEAALSGKTIGEVVAEQEIMSAEDFADLTEIGALLGRHSPA